jgi:hypothetical protein
MEILSPDELEDEAILPASADSSFPLKESHRQANTCYLRTQPPGPANVESLSRGAEKADPFSYRLHKGA